MEEKMTPDETVDPNDTFNILIATDIHLDFQRNKRQRTEDSFITFEEILQYAKANEVDFILLGGDLFDETKPSLTAMIKCVDLLRKYCMGPREIKIEFLSEPEEIFKHCAKKTVNYEDPNFNVSMPVFSIHGNHDDPSFSAQGSMDLLASTGLVNYFGKWPNVTNVTVPPLIIKKGKTHVAIYGISYINDQRLSRQIKENQLHLLRPEMAESCFNICVLHQNRVRHMDNAFIPENKLPDFLDFVIWGHEHECRITPEYEPLTGYHICQPGSSVATSLCEGEAVPKHVGILSINGTKFKLKELPLKTIRPFVFDNLYLKEEDIPVEQAKSKSDSIADFADAYIENVMIPEASNLLTGHPKQPKLPLLRLRIFYTTDEEIFEPIRVSMKYCDEVANPTDIILFRKYKDLKERGKAFARVKQEDTDDIEEIYNADGVMDFSMHNSLKDIAETMFKEHSTKLSVLSANGMTEALNRFVDGADSSAFQDILGYQMKETMEYLEKTEAETNDALREEMITFRDIKIEKEQEERGEIERFLNDSDRRKKDRIEVKSEHDDSTHSDKEPVAKSTRGKKPQGTAKRGRGRGRGRGSKSVAVPPLDVNVSQIISANSDETNATQKSQKALEQTVFGGFMPGGSQKVATDESITDDSDSN